MKFTTVKEFTDYLYHLPHLHDKSNLTYIKRLLAQLGNPQDQVKTIHVTGTNGKGSTSYYLSNLLQKAGQQTGLFVSPYIISFNERIQLNGQGISDSDLLSVANEVWEAMAAVREQDQDPDFGLVTFEYEVAMAFAYFAHKDCDYAVIEVGIGGEHDKTNVITPEVSIITTIGLDHEMIIGPTIQDIAREKSGVIKYKRPVVLGNIPESVKGILEKKIAEEASTGYWLGKNFRVLEAGSEKFVVSLASGQKYDLLPRPEVETFDAAMALRAFSLLCLKNPAMSLEAEAAEAAINETAVPGRYQIIQRRPMIVLDGAHNLQAMGNLLNFAHGQAKARRGRLHALVGMMKDKDIDQVLDLFQAEDDVVLTTVDYPRAARKEEFPAKCLDRFSYQADPWTAYQKMASALADEDLLLVSGSFYLVSAILLKLHAEQTEKE